MNIEYQFALSIIICYFIFVVFFKALRDIIRNRFKWSIFDNIKWKWLHDYLTGSNPNAPSAIDGWHQSDGVVVLFPLALIVYWGNRLIFYQPIWKATLAFLLVTVAFYIIFNFQYHYLWMKKEYKGQKAEKKD
jgi:hypothetical protein